MAGIRRAFADLSVGQVHYAAAGQPSAPPVLLLHQSPRSWLEYRDVLPVLGRRCHAIAMDTAGFGDSAPVAAPASIEKWAAVAAELLALLGVGPACVVGHHTGGVIAVELAAAQPVSSDDRNMKLLGLYWSGADAAALKKLAADILSRQRPDGGWRQHDGLVSDAYATGQTLYSSLSYGLGGGAGLLLAGWSWERLGAAASFSISAAFALAGAALVTWRVRV